MNKKFLLLLIPITTLVLSGCGKRSPGGSTSGDDPTTAQPTSGATTGSPTSGTTGGSSGTTGTTGGSSTTGSTSGTTSGSTSGSTSGDPGHYVPVHAGTESDPFDAVDAYNVAAELESCKSASAKGEMDTDQQYYVRGVVTEFVEAWSSSYGNYHFKIGDSQTPFIGYRLFNGPTKAKFPLGTELEVGDTVTMYATLIHWYDDMETNDGYIHSIQKASTHSLESISISGQKTSYLQGDTFVKPVVTAHYSDETENEVTASATFTGYDLSSTGNQTVTVSYTEGGQTRTTTYSINVAADELQSIAIGGSMTDTSYAIGESWDPSGLTVTGTYSSGNKNVTSLVEWSYSPLTPEAAGVGESTLEVTATLSGETDSKQVIVEVTAAESRIKEAYEVAAALDKGADTGSTKYTFTGTVSATIGNSYFVQELGYGMYVYNTQVTGIAVGKVVTTEAPLKNYNNCLETGSGGSGSIVEDGVAPTPVTISNLTELGEHRQNILANVPVATFVSRDQAWVSTSKASLCTFNIGGDDIIIKVDKYCDATVGNAFNAATADTNYALTNLITTKNNDNLQFFATSQTTIEEITKEIDSISISTHPTMLSYVVGDHFDPTGLVIDVLYDDDSHDLVPYAGNEAKFSFSPSLTTALTSSDTSVAITYSGKTANESISVVEDTLQEIVISGDMTNKSYSVGNAWDPTGLVATGNYNISGAKVLTDVVWAYSPETAIAGTTSVNVTATKAGVTSAAFTVNGITVSATEEHTVSWTATAAANLGSPIAAQGGTNTGSISTGSFSWNYTRTLVWLNSGSSDYLAFQGSTWIQMGSSKGLESLTFTTSAIPGTIKSVSVVCATAGTHTITIDVGGTKYLNGVALQTYSGTSSATNPDPTTAGCIKTGTGTSSGAITITLASSATTTGKALLIRSITVVYEA